MVLMWVLVGIIVVLLVIIVALYNSLVATRNRVKNAWSQIDVQLKRRADLVPNLVETVKGYMKHERATLEAVTKARAALVSATTVKEKAQATNMLTGALKSLFAVAESYPDLKASQNFLQLQEELSGIENKIAYARQFYNDSVMSYDIALQKFPTNMIAGIFGFKKEFDYFEAGEAERATPKVSFE